MNKAKNPVFGTVEKTSTIDRSYAASYTGIGIKAGILLLFTILSGGFAWWLLTQAVQGDASKLATVITILSVSGIVTLISVIVASFIPRVAMPFSILYTLGQGFTLGALTYVVELSFPGANIAMIAVVITILLFGIMLLLYTSRTIRATNRFRKIMYVGIFTILIGSIAIGISSIYEGPMFRVFAGNTTISIIVSLFLITYGAFMLVLNFDQAEAIVEYGAPKNYEWTVALGLMITIIWIYVEVLRLLVILMQNQE